MPPSSAPLAPSGARSLREGAVAFARSLEPDVLSGEDAAVVVRELAMVEKAVATARMFAAVRVARTARDTPQGRVHGVDELPALVPDADVVVLTVPLDETTHHLVDAALLARMADGALLVNVARGKVVDTDALLAELRTGRLRAALDVTDPEPLPPDHPLWHAPNVLVTAHQGGNTDATFPRVAALVRRQLETLLAGGEPVNVVART